MQLFDLQDSWNKGMTERPDLLQARLNVQLQGIQRKVFTRNQFFPPSSTWSVLTVSTARHGNFRRHL